MRAIVIALVLLATMFVTPGVSAEPDPPTCHDRSPIVNGGVVQVWLTRSCQPKVVFNEPDCWIGDLNICP